MIYLKWGYFRDIKSVSEYLCNLRFPPPFQPGTGGLMVISILDRNFTRIFITI